MINLVFFSFKFMNIFVELIETRGNGDIYFPFIIAITANYLGILMANITLKRFGRKCTISIGNILSALFSIMSAFAKNKDTNLCLIYYASAKIFSMCSHISLSIWMYELFPRSHCSQAINFCETLSQFCLIAVPVIIFYVCISLIRNIFIFHSILQFIYSFTNKLEQQNRNKNNTRYICIDLFDNFWNSLVNKWFT
jgi:MFS family permease